MGLGPSLINPELSSHQNIVGRNRTMPKKVKMIFCLAACFGVIFTFLPRPALAEAGKPVAAAVDGENIWVTDNSNHQLVRLRASDGSLIAAYSVSSPLRVLHDGINVWTVSNAGIVTKVRAKDGVVLASYPAGGPASGIAFDGENVWVSNPESDKVTKIRASDGSIVGSYTVGKSPDGLL